MEVTALTDARRRLQRVEGGLEILQLTMLGIQGTLPEPAAEPVRLLDVESMDAAMELRAVIACVLQDYIDPAIRDLRDALVVTQGERED